MNSMDRHVVLVCGGRDYADRDHVFHVLDALHVDKPITRLVHGAAKGADSLAAEWADARGVEARAYPANWNRYRNFAGPIRNRDMMIVENPNVVLVFEGGSGTKDMASIGTMRVRSGDFWGLEFFSVQSCCVRHPLPVAKR